MCRVATCRWAARSGSWTARGWPSELVDAESGYSMQDVWRGAARRCCCGGGCCVSAYAPRQSIAMCPTSRRVTNQQGAGLAPSEPHSKHFRSATPSRARTLLADHANLIIGPVVRRGRFHAAPVARRGTLSSVYPLPSPASARRCPSRNAGPAGVLFNSAPPARKASCATATTGSSGTTTLARFARHCRECTSTRRGFACVCTRARPGSIARPIRSVSSPRPCVRSRRSARRRKSSGARREAGRAEQFWPDQGLRPWTPRVFGPESYRLLRHS